MEAWSLPRDKVGWSGAPHAVAHPDLRTALFAGTFGTAQHPAVRYKPKFFLVNGKPYTAGDAPLDAGNVGQKVLIRFMNMGLTSHAPVLKGQYLRLIAEDGNLYPYPKQQYSALLPAGKTLDALWKPTVDGAFPLYDRSLHLTNAGVLGGGMLTYLSVSLAAGAPAAANDSATVMEGGTVTVLDTLALSVLANDADPNALPLTAALVTGPVNASSFNLNPDGTFSYLHDGSETTSDRFTYVATNGTWESVVAAARITVNQVNEAPVAVGDAYDAVAQESLYERLFHFKHLGDFLRAVNSFAL